MHLANMRVRPVYARLLVVVAVVSLIVSGFVAWTSRDSAPPIGPSELVAGLPLQYRDVESCTSRGWVVASISAPNHEQFDLCLPTLDGLHAGGVIPDGLQAATLSNHDRYVRTYVLKQAVTVWIGFLVVLIVGLFAANWVADASGKGFLLYESDLPLLRSSFVQAVVVISVSILAMSIFLSIGRIKQAMWASAEYPLIGFLLVWVGFELFGKRVRFSAALVTLWSMVLLGAFVTWPLMEIMGKDALGLFYTLPALLLLTFMRRCMPHPGGEVPRPSRKSRGVRAGLALLLSFGFSMLLVIPAALSDLLRTIW